MMQNLDDILGKLLRNSLIKSLIPVVVVVVVVVERTD